MDRKLIDYLPPVLREVLEFKAINEASEPEIALAWAALEGVLANQFLDSAGKDGVAVWEKELKIFPKDTDTLDSRKARIKAAWNLDQPYTLPWLKNWLAGLCGPDGYKESVSDYTINIELDYTALPEGDGLAAEIINMLSAARPANMRILLDAILKSFGSVSCGAFIEQAYDIELDPLRIKELETGGSAVFGGALEFCSEIEIYPVPSLQEV